MPYIEGPHMDWTVNDNLHHRFLKWHLKCKNILECELAALPEYQQCKKVISWSGNCSMDQYVSWNLPSSELTLDAIWGKYEEYCKPQSNEVWARFDLLMSFRQGNCSVDEWYNAMHAQVNLATPPETAKILHRDIFWFFLRDEDFVSRTISDGSINLDRFPGSRVCQLPKKLVSSKATVRHIKQVSGELQVTQINLLHHQRTELPQHRYKKKKSHTKPTQGNSKLPCRNDPYQGQMMKGNHFLPSSNRLPPSNNHNRCSKCGNTAHHEGFTCPAKKYQCKVCHTFGHFTSQCFQKKQYPQQKFRQPKAHQIQIDESYNHLHNYSSDVSLSEDSFSLQIKVRKQTKGIQKLPNTIHLITNIVYRLKQHHTRNQYLRARIDTGAEVNLMPVSVYRLIYQDQDLKKLTPSNLKIGTYMTDTIRIIGTTIIYLIHPDSKKPTKMTFHVASNKCSMLLSCNTSLTLGLIQFRPRLDYLPPRASLMTSNEDHPRKTKTQVQVQKHELIAKTNDQHHNIQGNMSKPPALITNQEQILQEYPDVFEGIGKFPGPPYYIQVDPKVTLKQAPCRPIPIHLKDAFQKEINQMLQAGVLLPLTEATLWINSFVIVEKRSNHRQVKLRICLDPTNLNKAVMRELYHFRTPEDISHMLADAHILTVCDCKKGYWHQTIDEASSYLTMFNTEVGRYRFMVMPFGITVAGDVFQ